MKRGFTLLEIMLAISIMAVVSMVTYMSFSTVATAWKTGIALTDSLNNGDYVAEQLVMGLRSAYYPEARGTAPQYGFWNEDGGSGEHSRDMISWVKLGTALVGQDCAFAGSPHRVKLTIEDNDDGEPAVAIRAWRLHGQPDDFEPDYLEPLYLSTKVVGFNCRSAWRKVNDEIEWFDEWEETNRVPTVLELTFWLKPPKEGEPPIEVKRAIGIRGAAISWQNR